METLFFWIAWGIISVWALRTFYFSFSKEKLERLRKTSVGLTASVLVLTLLPWLPPFLGGANAVSLALGGNTLAILLFVLLIISLIFFFQKEYLFLKIAAVLTVLATLVLFALMVIIRPGTFTLSLYDIAPIVAVLILLTLDVVVFLLWQQMQLLKKGEVIPTTKRKINAGIIAGIVVILGGLLYTSGGRLTFEPSGGGGELDLIAMDPPPQRKKVVALAPQGPGLVCINNNFSFQAIDAYTVLFQSNSNIAMQTQGVLLTVANYGSDSSSELEAYLDEAGYAYAIEKGIYAYELLSDIGDKLESSRSHALSTTSDTFVITVFYRQPMIQVDAETVIQGVSDTIRGGC